MPSLSSGLRCGIALLSLLGVAVAGDERLVAPSVVAVVVLELLADRVPRLRVAALVASTVVVAGVVALVPAAMVLPLLLVPSYRAGEHHGARAAALVAVAAGTPAVWVGVVGGDAFVEVQWAVLGVLLGQLGAWNGRVIRQARRSGSTAAREAGRLLGRVQDLARQLPTGLDVPAVASLVVEEASVVGFDRAALLVRADDDSVTPVALHGVDRVPWRDPVTAPGTPYEAWHRQRLTHDVRLPDAAGRRRGSSMLAVPLADRDDELLGLLVLERESSTGFTTAEQETVQAACDRYVAHLHAAMAFTALRHVAEIGERERLAREMHDGIAQDLSALGIVVDAASRRARSHPEATQALAMVRSELTRTISDIRLSIADLRSTALPERGLGAAVTSHVHALAASSDVAVTLSIQESAFRFPAHVESVLLRLVQDFLGDARSRPGTTAVGVDLELGPPRASVRLDRDGAGGWEPDRVLVDALRELGGDVVTDRSPSGVRARLEVGAPTAITREAAPYHPRSRAAEVAQPSWLASRLSGRLVGRVAGRAGDRVVARS